MAENESNLLETDSDILLIGSRSVAEAFGGKQIAALGLSEDRLLFTFADDTKMQLLDDGQSCCEDRYMRSDDDLQYFVGSRLMGVEVRDGPETEDGYTAHEIQFLVITTDKGAFTIETHNEHNGNYSGFLIRAMTEQSDD